MYLKNFSTSFFILTFFNNFELRSKIDSLIILNFVQKLSFLIFLNIRSGVISSGYPLGPLIISQKIIYIILYFCIYICFICQTVGTTLTSGCGHTPGTNFLKPKAK